ncbi:MAG: GAF sensor-containing protein serine phosphatase [Chloroflexi bacterium OLB13]|nr:MAG: GAF sensor-containing protein serine phosphatase [Chloroflexi bacterium OLB13]
MGADVLTIIDQWSRSLAPPRDLLARLLDIARSSDRELYDLRLYQLQDNNLVPTAAAVPAASDSERRDVIRLSAHPALTPVLSQNAPAFAAPDRWYFPAVADLARASEYVLEVTRRGALGEEARARLIDLARYVGLALDLRDSRAVNTFAAAMERYGDDAQRMIEQNLLTVLTTLTTATSLGQMADIVAQRLLTKREVLAVNVLQYDEAGYLQGWSSLPANHADVRRSITLDIAWPRLGGTLRDRVCAGDAFVVHALGPDAKLTLGTALYEWLHANDFVSAAFYPISRIGRTSAVLVVLSTVSRVLSDVAIHSFQRLADRIALLTDTARGLSEVSVREHWASRMVQASQQMLDASEYPDVAAAVLDALPSVITTAMVALFNEPIRGGMTPRLLTVEAVASRFSVRGMQLVVDELYDSARNRESYEMLARLGDAKPFLDVLENSELARFAPRLAHSLMTMGCKAAAVVGLVADNEVHGMLVIGATTADLLQPLQAVLPGIGSSVTAAIARLHDGDQRGKPNDLSRIVEFSRALLAAHDEIDVMKAVRRCLAADYDIVAWTSVQINPFQTQRVGRYVVNRLLFGQRSDVPDIPLHETFDDERSKWFFQTWLASRAFGKPVFYHSDYDWQDDPVMPVLIRQTKLTFDSAVALPVIVNNQLVAQIYVALHTAVDMTPGFAQLCQLVCDQVSLKVRTMNESNGTPQKQEFPVLQVVNDLALRLLTVRDEPSLLQEGARTFATALGMDHAGITLVREDNSAEVVAEYPDEKLIGLIIPPDNPYLVQTIETRQPVIVEDVAHDAKLTPENRAALVGSGIKQMLFLPMLDESERCFGSIGLDIKRDNFEFDLTIVEVARTLTNQLAMLFLSLRQFREAQRQAAQLESLTRLSSDLVMSRHDDEVFEAVADRLHDILPADDLWVLVNIDWLQGRSPWPELEQSEPGAVRVVMKFENGRPYRPEEPINYRLDGTPAERAQKGDIVSVSDMRTRSDLRPLVASRPVRSVLAAPLIVAERIVGVVEIDSVQPEAYTRNDTNVFVQMVSQISGALDRARNLQAAQRSAKTEQVTAHFAERLQGTSTVRDTLVTGTKNYQDSLGAKSVTLQLGSPNEQSQSKSRRDNVNGARDVNEE